MVNAKQVAALAGVSSATVSRALSSPEQLRPETLRRVNAAIAQLDYIPFAPARVLRSGRTRSIGIVAPTLMNELYAKAVDSLENTLDELGYTVLLTCYRNKPEVELRGVRAVLERHVEGMAIIGTQHHPSILRLVRRQQIPYVLMWATDQERQHPTVGYDNRLALRRITSYLVQLGHRHFAVLAGPYDTQQLAMQRVSGVRDVLTEYRIELDADAIVATPYDTEAVRVATRRLLARVPRPTALICNNDLLASAAIAECRALGVSVPADISITGFGDWELAQLITPTLTTMRSNPVYIGEVSAQNLIAQINGTASAEVAQTEFEPELMIRESTGSPPDTA
ncbi:MAG: substrate-binding domain-containing protein [Pusillimonas sp.]